MRYTFTVELQPCANTSNPYAASCLGPQKAVATTFRFSIRRISSKVTLMSPQKLSGD
jgi:hypothetical protein